MLIDLLKAMVSAIIPVLFVWLKETFPDFPLEVDTLTALVMWLLIQIVNRVAFTKDYSQLKTFRAK